jgi:hypothetical protein
MSTCEDCGKEILFLKHKETGKVNPIEAQPDPKGNLRINLETGQYRFANDVEYERWKVGHPKAIPLHISHFARCPNAGKFRKKTRAKAR